MASEMSDNQACRRGWMDVHGSPLTQIQSHIRLPQSPDQKNNGVVVYEKPLSKTVQAEHECGDIMRTMQGNLQSGNLVPARACMFELVLGFDLRKARCDAGRSVKYCIFRE